MTISADRRTPWERIVTLEEGGPTFVEFAVRMLKQAGFRFPKEAS